MKKLAISHVYGYRSNTVSEKTDFLVNTGFTVIGPATIVNHFNQVTRNVSTAHKRFLPVTGDPKSVTKFIFLSGRLGFSANTKSVLVETEPWSFLFLQVLLYRKLYSPDAAITLFTWENFERAGWRGWILRRFYRLAAKHCATIVCGNEAGKRLFLSYGTSPSKLHVITQFGVNGQLFRELPAAERAAIRKRILGTDQAATVIGFAGRLVPEKGVDELKTAFSRIHADHPETRLLVVGTGSCAALFSDLPGTLVVPGVSQDEMPLYLNAMDMLVLPSRSTPFWLEQFGRVLIEAMACGALAIGSNSGEIPNVIGNASCIFPETDAVALEAVLRKFLLNPNDYQNARNAQQQRVKHFYNHEVYQQLLQVIK